MNMADIKIYIDYIAKVIEVVGIAIIVTGTALALLKFIFGLQKKSHVPINY